MAQDNAASNNASGAPDNNNKGGCGGDGTSKNASGVKKVEEVQPHAVQEQLPGVQYCIKSPPPWRSYIFLYLL